MSLDIIAMTIILLQIQAFSLDYLLDPEWGSLVNLQPDGKSS